MRTLGLFLKRLIDLAFALVLMILTAPVFIVVCLLLKIELGGEIFFFQTRPGLQGKAFKIYKFRTMTNEKAANGELLPDEQRLTRTGKVLRKLSLDEIPQLFNVLKGELSLVGPRPLLMQYLPLYNKHQAKRHLVKPGITGWAQVNGRNAISWEEKFDLDVWYVENWSLALDFKILWLTFFKVIKQDGVNTSENKAMPFFTGTPSKQEKNSSETLDTV